MAASRPFRFPVRTADAFGFNDEEQRSTEDIAADLDFQDNAIEDFLTNELPQTYVQFSDVGSGVVDPSQLASGTPGAGKAPVGNPPAWTDIATQTELDAEATTRGNADTAEAVARAAGDALNFPNAGLRRGTVAYLLNGLDTNTTTTVIFSSTFTSPPVVVVTPSSETQKNVAAAITSVNSERFVVRVFPTAGTAFGTTTGSVHWHAFAP